MIQPLDQYFDDYASDTLKGFVESGGEELKKCISNDKGEMMAIPAPNIAASGWIISYFRSAQYCAALTFIISGIVPLPIHRFIFSSKSDEDATQSYTTSILS